MRKLFKFMMVLAIAISLPLEGFAAVLPACALMTQSNTKMSMPMQSQQVAAQSDSSQSKSQNCHCDCKQIIGQTCGQSVGCASCVNAVFAMFYHVPAIQLTANIFLSGPALHGPPLITSSHFRPPIIISA